jgi:excisionase family DNA binding protein
MTAAEVCAMLQCSEKTIKRWIATKRLRAIKINGMVRIPASAIAEIAREA